MKANKTNVQTANVQTANVQVTDQATEQTKVTAKVAIKSISRVAAYVRTERRGVNATIRIIMDAAREGDRDAINTIAALCDVPTSEINHVTIDNIRSAVNEYYPYVAISDKRSINVKFKSVHYTTASKESETKEQAKARIKKGFYSVEVVDYLVALTCAARARAKGQKQILLDLNKVYDDNKATTFTSVTVEQINEAAARRAFSYANVNIWHKSNIFGYYI